MTQRERILAIVAAVLLGGFGLKFGIDRLMAAFDARTQRRHSLQAELARKQAVILHARRKSQQLAQWEQQSLPANLQLARSLYQNWLVGLVDRAKLEAAQVNSSTPQARGDAYRTLTFHLSAQGDLAQVVRFLHDFYQGGHLHQIRSLTLSPGPAGRKLAFSATIEALSLPGAAHADRLNDQPAQRLARGGLESYLQPIANRNFFEPYVPPPPPPPRQQVTEPQTPPRPRTPPFDVARYAFLTAILHVGDEREAWISVRPTGETLRLRQGDAVRVGAFEGTLRRIGDRHIEIDCDGTPCQVALGSSLRR
ncbi:MAG: hypothetical protein K6T86_17150 [Pirellulales bacterium]|nr:hypothetical protein [Pirellulales bacterium]